MVRQFGPHELMKLISQGSAPPRPLFLPIVFSHAARIENLPLGAFLANPTKITQALRQMRGHLRSDGLTCYFDPYLEMKALGAELDWGSSAKPQVRWTRDPLAGDLFVDPEGMDKFALLGRIPVAVEVIRRMKAAVRDDCLLTAGVSGPFRLASELIRAGQDAPTEEGIPARALELASEAIAAVAKAFVEAGANVVIISEDLPAWPSGDASLYSLLAMTINIVRFYQAIPVLLLSSALNPPNLAFQESLDCIVCPVLSATVPSVSEQGVTPAPRNLGVAIPVSLMSEPQPSIEKFVAGLRRLNPGFQPALVTTSGDIPDMVDLRSWNTLRDLLIA